MENRKSVIAREYEKGAHRQWVFIYVLTGPQITGTLYRVAVLRDNVEQEHKRFESGDKYEIRKRFLNHGFDLKEDGWKQVNVRRDDPELAPFFEIE